MMQPKTIQQMPATGPNTAKIKRVITTPIIKPRNSIIFSFFDYEYSAEGNPVSLQQKFDISRTGKGLCPHNCHTP